MQSQASARRIYDRFVSHLPPLLIKPDDVRIQRRIRRGFVSSLLGGPRSQTQSIVLSPHFDELEGTGNQALSPTTSNDARASWQKLAKSVFCERRKFQARLPQPAYRRKSYRSSRTRSGPPRQETTHVQRLFILTNRTNRDSQDGEPCSKISTPTAMPPMSQAT